MPEPSINASIRKKTKKWELLKKKIRGGRLKLKNSKKREQTLRHGDGGNSCYRITASGDGQLFLRITTIIKLLFNY